MVAVYNNPTETVIAENFAVTIAQSTDDQFGEDSCQVITSSDMVTWQIETIPETLWLLGGCHHGGFVYFVGTDYAAEEQKLLIITSVNPVVYEAVPIGDSYDYGINLSVAVDSNGVAAAFAAIGGQLSPLDGAINVSYSSGNSWGDIGIRLPDSDFSRELYPFFSGGGQRNIAERTDGGFNVAVVNYSGSEYTQVSVFKLGPVKRRVIDLSSLLDQPYDFAQSAL